MPFFSLKDQNVYYEIHGEQEKTLIILNGIMMSATSWSPFINYLKQSVKVVLVDFFDQGKSDFKSEPYDQKIQEEVVEALIKELKLKQITLLGISYGGEIAMRYAIDKGHTLEKLILANTTAFTSKQLKAIGENWIYAAKTYDGKQFFKATIPPIYSEEFFERNIQWLDQRETLFTMAFDEKWYEGFIRLVRSAENHDVRPYLKQIKVPTLIIGAQNDLITPIKLQEDLYRSIDSASMLIIPNCGHAAMYEKPKEFFSAVMGFVSAGLENFAIG